MTGPRVAAREFEQWARGRRPYLDNLKAILIAGIIVIQGVLGNVGFDLFWHGRGG